MAKLLHIFYHKEGTFSLLCQQVLLFTHSFSLILFLFFKKINRFFSSLFAHSAISIVFTVNTLVSRTDSSD